VHVSAGMDGPVWQSIIVTGDVAGCEPSDSAKGIHGVTVEYRALRQEKRIELLVSFRKAQLADPEADYVAFPFSAPGARIVYEAQGGETTPGVQQLPGSSTDWQTIQNYASVRGKDGQILFSSDEAPLVMWGDLNMGKWMPTMVIDRPHIYSFALNNYWVTNFLADQFGEIVFRYSLTSTTDTTATTASHFGWGFRTPLVGRALPPRATASGALSGSMLHLSSPDVLVVNARPAAIGNAVILHLRETGGKKTSVDLSSLVPGRKPASVSEVNAIEAPIRTTGTTLTLEPYEVKFLRLSY
jgi:alpha-mannosidase